MNIIDMNLEPLNEKETEELESIYTQDFNKMSERDAAILLQLLLPAMKSTQLDSELANLLLRRLNMIIDFKNYPERLI